jgi:methyl-accepting chemotaxis protein
MNHASLSFKLTAFLIAAVAIAIAIAGGMYGLLRRSDQQGAIRIAQVLSAKNAAYQLLETVVDVQTALQNTLRLRDPDEIEKGIEQFKERLAAAEALVNTTADLPPSIRETLTALGEIDRQAIERFLVGENGAAFELLINAAPQQFDALLQAIRAHSVEVEASVMAEADAGQVSLRRNLLWAGVVCAVLVILLTVYGWRFRRAITGRLRNLAGILSEASNEVAGAAAQVSLASESLATGSTDQAASLEETSASLKEMAGMTRRNAESAAKANALASQARQAADGGAQDMTSMNEAMHAIKGSSDDIAKIIRTIDEIAFQTNILALNAAVEAARAGAAGAGFAVVADEVRTLARRSAEAARETAMKIEGAIGKTAQGVHYSESVTRKLADIVEKVRQVDALVAEVSTASREESQGVEQITRAVSRMDQIVQRNAAGAEESASAAEELNSQATALQDSVGELRTLIDGQNAGRVGPSTRTAPVAGSQPSSTKAMIRRSRMNRGGDIGLTGAHADSVTISQAEAAAETLIAT